MTKWIVVDVESDGPCPGINSYSMISFGAVVLDRKLDKIFFGQTAPISPNYHEDALKVSDISREQHLAYPSPELAIVGFAEWLESLGDDRLIFVSDNPAYDWQFMNYYLHQYWGSNPFGFSARRIGDLYSGLVKDTTKGSSWKKYRKTKHTHNPVDDAKGNAEALLVMHDKYGLNVPL